MFIFVKITTEAVKATQIGEISCFRSKFSKHSGLQNKNEIASSGK